MGTCFHWPKCKVVNEARLCYQGQYWDVNSPCLLREELKLKVVDWCLPVRMKEGVAHNIVRTLPYCTILLKMWYNDAWQHVVKDTCIKGPGDIKHQDILSDYIAQEGELCWLLLSVPLRMKASWLITASSRQCSNWNRDITWFYITVIFLWMCQLKCFQKYWGKTVWTYVIFTPFNILYCEA